MAGLAGEGAGTASAGYGMGLTGTWYATYKRTPGDQLAGIWTFHADGTLVTTGSDHATRTPSHGYWESRGGDQYASMVVGINLDANGKFAGTTRVDTDVTLDSTGTIQNNISRVTVYDASGNLMSEVTSVASATKLPMIHRSDPNPQMGPAG
ncbi:MAG TPA: hypothetical protein VFO27_07090 [Bryobacteraceae bacterium]|nr:hypothetical protein [Bryobacteraceae bacterium]